jgi:hypothetical protein
MMPNEMKIRNNLMSACQSKLCKIDRTNIAKSYKINDVERSSFLILNSLFVLLSVAFPGWIGVGGGGSTL